MLFWVGAVLCGYLGYRLHEWWVPAAVACVVVAVQVVMLHMVAAGKGSGVELLALSLLMNLVMFFATFSIGRAIGQRRKGVR